MNKEAVPHSGMSLSFVAALLTEPSAQCPRGRRVRQQMKGYPADTDKEAGFSREKNAISGFDSRLNPRSCVVRPLTAAGSVKCRVSLADVFIVVHENVTAVYWLLGVGSALAANACGGMRRWCGVLVVGSWFRISGKRMLSGAGSA